MIVNILTKNPGKLKAAVKSFKKFGIEIKQARKDYPEIQADSSLEIARFTALKAAKDLNSPIIREDHSLFINTLGIPGPYTSFIEKRLPAKKLLRILNNEKDRSGYFEIATVYAKPNGTTLEYKYKVPISFEREERVPDPRGGWNGIIRFQNESRTLTEYPEEERLDIWGKNYLKIAKHLTKKRKD